MNTKNTKNTMGNGQKFQSYFRTVAEIFTEIGERHDDVKMFASDVMKSFARMPAPPRELREIHEQYAQMIPMVLVIPSPEVPEPGGVDAIERAEDEDLRRVCGGHRGSWEDLPLSYLPIASLRLAAREVMERNVAKKYLASLS